MITRKTKKRTTTKRSNEECPILIMTKNIDKREIVMKVMRTKRMKTVRQRSRRRGKGRKRRRGSISRRCSIVSSREITLRKENWPMIVKVAMKGMLAI